MTATREAPATARWHSRIAGSGEDAGASAGRGTSPTPDIPRRELVTLLAYLETGSHKAAAYRLGVSESTCRQRVSLLLGRVRARNTTQAVWALREALEAEFGRPA